VLKRWVIVWSLTEILLLEAANHRYKMSYSRRCHQPKLSISKRPTRSSLRRCSTSIEKYCRPSQT